MEEIWKDIPDYEGIYQASTFGNIRTVEGKTTHSVRHGERHWKSRILKGRGDNYKTGRRVSLWKDKKRKEWLVARLVAITFLGKPESNLTVNHKDGNRFNNNIENLEWLTIGDNVRHAVENGLSPQNEVLLYKNSQLIRTFRSMKECSVFLGRSKNYASKRYCKHSDKMISKDGEEYDYKVNIHKSLLKPT